MPTRARDEFTRLDRLARTQRSGAQSVGGHIERRRRPSSRSVARRPLSPPLVSENGMHTRVGFVGIRGPAPAVVGVDRFTDGAAAAANRSAARASSTRASRAVLVDVVVRDRRGQPVRDLTPADFEIARGRRAADDRLVHAASWTALRPRPSRRRPAAATSAPGTRSGIARRRSGPVRDRARLRSPQPGGAAAGRAGGAGAISAPKKNRRTTSACSASISR